MLLPRIWGQTASRPKIIDFSGKENNMADKGEKIDIPEAPNPVAKPKDDGPKYPKSFVGKITGKK